MKTWQFWVIIAVIVFVIVPLIVYATSINAVAKVAQANPNLLDENTTITTLPDQSVVISKKYPPNSTWTVKGL